MAGQIAVVTGSTRGIGHGLAVQLLERGCSVVISGRSRVAEVSQELGERFGAQRVLGVACDVGEYAQVVALWDAALAWQGRVDLWVNNAGTANPRAPFWEQDPAQLEVVVRANVIGLMYGCRVALQGMRTQGSGAIYNMEGLGSDGRMVEGLIPYGSTKRAVRYLTRGLVKESAGGPVIVGSVSPGMVLTDLLLDELKGKPAEEREELLKVYRILGERVETVTPWLVESMLANTKHGARFAWLSGTRAGWRFATSWLIKRDPLQGMDLGE